MADGEHVFISYARADGLDLAKRLYQDLEITGHKAWMDLEGIELGAPFDVRIEEGICSSSVVLAVMTPSSFRDNSICRDEVAFAHSENKNIVPIRINPNLKPSLLLCRRNWVDFTEGYENGLSSLLKFLGGDRSALVSISLPETGDIVPLDFSLEIARYVTDFTGRGWINDLIEEWLDGYSEKAFIITGEPGIGKSAIAAWLSQERSDRVAAIHFCSSDYSRTLNPFEFVYSLLGQLSTQMSGYRELAQKRRPEQQRSKAIDAFRELIIEPLRQLPGMEPSLIIVDSLDEATLQEGETILDVLDAQSEYLPKWVRIIATTRNDKQVIDRIKRFHIYELEDESAKNCHDLSGYIQKRLSDTNLSAKAGLESAYVKNRLEKLSEGNFLYAKMALDSLSERTLDVRDLGEMLPGLSNFYTKIFQETFPDIDKYLEEYTPLLKVLSVAFEPLPFDLLRKILKIGPETLHRRLRVLQPYLDESFVKGDKAYSFFHRSLQEWLISREDAGDYWVEPESGHSIIADFLKDNFLDYKYAIRYLAKHLIKLSRWDDLYTLLSDFEYFYKAWHSNEFEVKCWWADLESSSTLRKEEAYKDIINNPERFHRYVWETAKLLRDTGNIEQAEPIYQYSIEYFRKNGNRDGLQASLSHQAIILWRKGDLAGAMELHKEQESICREIGNLDGLQDSLGGQAIVLKAQGDLDGAIKLHKEEEKICRTLGNDKSLSKSLNNQAIILSTRGDLESALVLLKETERLCSDIGELEGILSSLVNQASILRTRGGLEGALDLLKEAEEISRNIGNPYGISGVIGNQADILQTQGKLDDAMQLYKQQEIFCREINYPDGLQSSLGNQGIILKREGDLKGAILMYKEQENILVNHGIKDGLHNPLVNQANILNIQGDLDGAIKIYKDAEKICREIGDRDGLSIIFNNQALIHRNQGDLDSAMSLFKEQEQICREISNPDGLQSSLGNQGIIIRDQGDFNGALKLFKAEEQICREVGIPDGIASALSNQAVILIRTGELYQGMELLAQSEQIFRELGDQCGLQTVLEGQAGALAYQDKLDDAIKLLKEQEKICRLLGIKDGLSRSLANQAIILADQGNKDVALALAEEALSIAENTGYLSVAEQVNEIIEAIRG